jgi:uncharacterized protein YjbI with pentapeptide repeats
MKAQEVLNRYAKGRRDFRGADLRGLSFKGKDLSGADFSTTDTRVTDIRGTNFSQANLTGAKFIRAKAGLQTHQAIFLLGFAFLTTSLLGFASGLGGFFVSLLLTRENIKQYVVPGTLALIVLAVIFIAIVSQRYAVAKATAGYRNLSKEVKDADDRTVSLSLASGFLSTVLLAFAVVIVPSVNPAVVVALLIFGGFLLVIAIFLAIAMAGALSVAGPSAVAVVLMGAIGVSGAVARVLVVNGILNANEAIYIVIVGAVIVGLTALYIGWKAIEGARYFFWIRLIALNFAAIGGTSFRGANLTNANLTYATLKNTDFREANLTHTCFLYSKKLDQSRQENPLHAILSNPPIRDLLVSGKGQSKSYVGANLSGAYLIKADLTGANLTEANIIGANLQDAKLANSTLTRANLSNTNLQKADLTRATLVQTQLDKTDFTGAILTGACIEDWGITRNTKLDDVKCEYVYMRLPTKDKLDCVRKPDDNGKIFADGEFGDFIKPIFDTLDLYHTQKVDPRDLAIALRNLADNNPDAEMQLKAVEIRGNNLLIRLATSSYADRSKLNADYFKELNEVKALNEIQKTRLAEQDIRIIKQQATIESFRDTPRWNVKNYTHTGDIMPDNRRNFELHDVNVTNLAGGDQTGVAGGDINGAVTVSIGKLAELATPEATRLADLLQQLQSAIESDTNLSAQDKAKALRQVKSLAEAGQNPKDEDKKGLADDAITVLKSILKEVPAVAACVAAFQQLLPLITSVFGLP